MKFHSLHEVIVDASVEECAVLEFVNFSRRNLSDFYGKDGGILKNIFKNNNHSFVNRSVYAIIHGFHHREFVWKVMWKRISVDEVIVFYAPIELNAVWNFPIAEGKVVRASFWTWVKFRRLPPFVGIPQTKISYMSQMDLAGYVPVDLINKLLPSRLMYLDRVRLVLDKSFEIDAAARADFVLKMGEYQEYSPEENRQINDILTMLKDFDKLPEITTVKTLSPLASSSIGRKPKESIAYGK